MRSFRAAWIAGALTACTPESDSVQVGDAYGGGTVVAQQDTGAGCHQLTIEVPPVWTCSEAQISAAKGEVDAESVGTASGDAALPPPRVELGATSCADIAGLRRPIFKAMRRQTVADARRFALSRCLPTHTTQYVGPGAGGGACLAGQPAFFADAGVAYSPTSALPGALPSSNASDDGASEYSTTNTQVAGVDEADFVKNDAGYVYVLTSSGLRVIDAWPAADTHELTRLLLPGTPTRLFLYGDKLVVYTRSGAPNSVSSAAAPCTYGYGCRPSAEPGGTTVLVYDVSAPAMPRELRRFELSGGYIASRRVGANVYTVVLDQGPVSTPTSNMVISASDPDAVDRSAAESSAAAEKAVDDLPDAYFLPKVSQQVQGQPSEAVDDCSQVLSASAADGTDFTSVVSFDLTAQDAPSRTLVASRAGFVYASGEALYLAAYGVGGGPYGLSTDSQTEQTTLHKFDLVGASTRYAGSANVDGHVLNQFSMDEQAGVLRVATSIGYVPNPNVTSSVTTFGMAAGKLTQLGAVTGIAPEEDIRSVRFDGDRGFVVTFKKTDPLFVLDLADPGKPALLGELKIPGFSTYMQPMDKDHLLAVGFDADDQGSFAYFNGIQIQIFDVSDLSAPTLLHKATIGTRGTASEGLTNHLAFNYFPQRGVLALPMTICEGGGNGVYGDTLTFSGLMVFDVSLAGGIHEHGRMPFVAPENANGVSCGTWWTQGTSEVKRSIFMDDFAIGLSDSEYRVAALESLGTPLKTLSIAGP